jgi:hypothetical protein
MKRVEALKSTFGNRKVPSDVNEARSCLTGPTVRNLLILSKNSFL